MRRSILALWAAPALVSVGCGCNQEYTFPEPLAVQFAETPPDFGSYLSFGKAPDGRRITMTYYDRITTGVGFATGTIADDGSITWLHEHVDGYPEADGLDRGDRGRYGSHVVGDDGTVWVAYQDSANGTLKAAQRLGPNQWEAGVVDPGVGLTQSGAGYWTSIGLLDGEPIIAHYDKAGGVLRVSRHGENGWSSETAWQAEDVGEYADLYVHNGVVYIAFYNAANGNLEMIEGTPGAWTHTDVDTPGDVGAWPNVWADDDEVVIAYHHVGDQDLRLIRRTGGSWGSPTVVDSGEFRGADTVFFQKDGLPHIVYFDGQDNDMLLASQRDDGSWDIQRVAGADRAVGFHNEVVEVNGRWFAGSYDHTNAGLYTTELFRELPLILLVGAALAAPVDLNGATLDQLDGLPGIGRAKATAIVAHRTVHGPFRSFDDLSAVSGIGPATVRILATQTRISAPVLAVQPPTPPASEARIPLVPSAVVLDPNTATTAQLATWPGITGHRAEAIVEARARRPFSSCDDLVRAVGVGPATVAGLRDLCVVRGPGRRRGRPGRPSPVPVPVRVPEGSLGPSAP